MKLPIDIMVLLFNYLPEYKGDAFDYGCPLEMIDSPWTLAKTCKQMMRAYLKIKGYNGDDVIKGYKSFIQDHTCKTCKWYWSYPVKNGMCISCTEENICISCRKVPKGKSIRREKLSPCGSFTIRSCTNGECWFGVTCYKCSKPTPRGWTYHVTFKKNMEYPALMCFSCAYKMIDLEKAWKNCEHCTRGHPDHPTIYRIQKLNELVKVNTKI
jgi:hypothetical protein